MESPLATHLFFKAKKRHWHVHKTCFVHETAFQVVIFFVHHPSPQSFKHPTEFPLTGGILTFFTSENKVFYRDIWRHLDKRGAASGFLIIRPQSFACEIFLFVVTVSLKTENYSNCAEMFFAKFNLTIIFEHNSSFTIAEISQIYLVQNIPC